MAPAHSCTTTGLAESSTSSDKRERDTTWIAQHRQCHVVPVGRVASAEVRQGAVGRLARQSWGRRSGQQQTGAVGWLAVAASERTFAGFASKKKLPSGLDNETADATQGFMLMAVDTVTAKAWASEFRLRASTSGTTWRMKSSDQLLRVPLFL